MEKETLLTVKKILIPVDRSEFREKILTHAIALSRAWGAELTAIHVIDPVRGVPGGKVKEKEKEREGQAKQEGMEVLNSIDPVLQKQGVNINKELVEKSDSISKAIIDYAKENNFHIIVIGTKGMTGVEEFFLGSVASNVIRH